MEKLIVFFVLIGFVLKYFSTPWLFLNELNEWRTSKSNYENTVYEVIKDDNLYGADERLNREFTNFSMQSEQTITNLDSILTDHQYSFVFIIFGVLILFFCLEFTI